MTWHEATWSIILQYRIPLGGEGYTAYAAKLICHHLYDILLVEVSHGQNNCIHRRRRQEVAGSV